MSKAKKLEVKKSVLEWCRGQAKQENELTIHWEGGGDSGWVYFQIDGKEVNNEYTEYLVDMMCSELDYGSWAGEFCASGSAIFSLEENGFTGIDEYREDERLSHSCEIVLQIPNDIWFDSISYRIECSEEGDTPSVTVSFNIVNGFSTEKHRALEEEFEKQIENAIPDIVQSFVDEGNEFRDIWESDAILKSECVNKESHIEAKITSIDIGTYTSYDKNIFLYIEEDEMLPEQEPEEN